VPDREEMAPGEIARSLLRLERGMEQLAKTIRDLDVVHRGEYEAHRQGDDARMLAVERDVKELRDDVKTSRRLVLSALVFPALLLVFGAIIAAVMSS
jgi:hypothetical protein